MSQEVDPAPELWERASDALTRPETLLPRESVRRRQLLVATWVMRSFGAWECWALFDAVRASHEPDNRLIRHLLWDQAVEVAALRDGSLAPAAGPTFHVTDRLVSPGTGDGILSRVPNLELVVHSRILGIDGETTGVRTHGAKLEWWGNGPPEWDGLVGWTRELRGVLEREPNHPDG